MGTDILGYGFFKSIVSNPPAAYGGISELERSVHKFVIIIVAAILVVPLSVWAAAPDYNTVDFGYTEGHTSGFSGGRGYQLAGSYAFDTYWYVAGSYGQNSFNGGILTGGFFTRDEIASVGLHFALTDSMDIVIRAGYANDHWKQGPSTNLFPGFVVATSDTQDGYDFGFGLRALPLDQLELNVFLDQDNVGLLSHDHNRSETVGTLGAMYKVTDSYGLGLSYARGSHNSASVWMLTGRWFFLPNQ